MILAIEKQAVNASLSLEDSKYVENSKNSSEFIDRFFLDLLNDKLKDEEVLLLQYIIDNAKFKLGTGWKESSEVENIEAWEDVEEISNTLSRNYSKALRRFEMRKLTEVSELTGHGNPREVRIIDSVQEILLDLPLSVVNKINVVIATNKNEGLPF